MFETKSAKEMTREELETQNVKLIAENDKLRKQVDALIAALGEKVATPETKPTKKDEKKVVITTQGVIDIIREIGNQLFWLK